jgi:hypothetical protein
MAGYPMELITDELDKEFMKLKGYRNYEKRRTCVHLDMADY